MTFNDAGKLVLRFFSHLHIEHFQDCWNWTAHKRGEYGGIKVDGIMERAHRLSWMLFRGGIPSDLCVLHKCIGNPLCCNPDHLYLGTKKNNADDRKTQGRGGNLKGVNNGRAKLTDELVMELRRLRPPFHGKKRPYVSDLARQYGIPKSTLNFLLNGQTWKHLPMQ